MKKKKDTNTPKAGVKADGTTPITRADIENRVRSIQTDIESVKESTAGLAVAAGLALALLLVFLAFVIGRSRGKAKYSFVEVRRA